MYSLRNSLAVGLITIAAASAGVLAHAGQGTASTGPQLKILKIIPLGGEGEWGFPTIDVEARRLYLPRTNVVQVVDLDKGTLVGTIPSVSTQVCHGVAMAPDQKLGFASAGKDNNVAAFDPATLKVTTRINSSVNPNAMIYDPASKRIVVMNHAAVTIIDPAKLNAKPAVIEMGRGLEFAVADGKGSVFVCVEHDDEVVRIDTKANKIANRWSVAPGKVPVGIAMDFKSNRLFVTCRSKVSAAVSDKRGLLAVIDAASGKVLSTPPIGAGASGVVFDPALAMAFSANSKDGTISVVKETNRGTYETTQTLKTIVGARHIAFDAKDRQCFLPCKVPSDGGETFGVVVVGAESSKKIKIEIIKLDDAPLAVRKAIEGRFPGAKVSTTERETDNGKVVFEVQLTHKDCKYEMHIKENGIIEAIEKEIALMDVPERILKAVKDRYPRANIQGAMKVDTVKDKKETPDHYLIAVMIGEKKREISVSLDGKTVK
jgi:DNA-binding beta-propeller fold protein YncE